MTLDPYAQLVTREVRTRLPDVRAVRTGSSVTWTLGTSRATLGPAGPGLWELAVITARGFAVRTYPERMDVDTARIAASNIVGHFDLAWCRGIDVAPFTSDEMGRFANR
jgi:hypothetical protein